MANPLLQTLLCLVGLQAATPPVPADLVVIATLGTPCLPAAYARIRFPSLERWTVADSLGQATVSSVPEGDLEIIITHLGTAALSGTVHIVPGETQVVLADLHSRELTTVSIPVGPAGPRDRLAAKVHTTSACWPHASQRVRVLLRETWISPEGRRPACIGCNWLYIATGCYMRGSCAVHSAGRSLVR